MDLSVRRRLLPASRSTRSTLRRTGELSRALSHELGVKKPKKNEPDANVNEEIGDLLLVLICLANARGADLEAIFENTLAKIQSRDSSRWTLKHQN